MGSRIEDKKYLPISEYQKRFFLEWVLAPLDNTYNVSFVNKIEGELDEEALKRTIKRYIKNIDVVHSQYSFDGNLCYYGDFSITDFYHNSTFNSNQSIESQIKKILYKPFDLTCDPLLRIHCIKHYNQDSLDFYFIFVAHHIICDAIWELQFKDYIQKTYNSFAIGKEWPFDMNKSFTEMVKVEHEIFNENYKINAREYWLKLIDDTPLRVDLPYHSDLDFINLDNILSDKTGESIYFNLTSTQTKLLRAYAKSKNTTLFIVLSSLYGLILSKFITQKKFMIDYAVNTRPREFKDAPGCFMNNVPMIFELESLDTFEDLVEILKEQRKVSKHFQGYSSTEIIQDQRKVNHRETNNIFNVGFSQSYLGLVPFELKDLEVTTMDIPWSRNSIYEIGLAYDDFTSDKVKFRLDYRKMLFDDHIIQQFVKTFNNIVNEVINDKEIIIKNYCILHLEEYDKIVYKWNDTDKGYPKDKTIYELFQEQVERTPENIALVFEGNELSYRELNEKSNQLARHIREQYKKRTKQELKPDTLIALFLNRSLETVVSILAVLKAGGAYVPIDTSYPQERIDYMLNDTNADLILSQRHLSNRDDAQLPEDKMIHIDLNKEFYKKGDTSNLTTYSKSSNLAYVIYTSGTSGKPKGVMIEHRNYLQLNYANNFASTHKFRTLWTNYTFDVSVFEIFNAFLHGSQLFILNNENKNNSEKFFNFLEYNRINYSYVPPFFIKDLADFLETKVLSSLNKILTGVEKISASDSNKITSHKIALLNGYGPTETTICSASYLMDNQLCQSKNQLPIGTPLSNEKVYILDSNKSPVPIGVVGELYIGGAGLSRGYLNNNELTDERFISNPFATYKDKLKGYTRLYRTGDLVRWLIDGNIEYLGRDDNQVKINGYRIELGEIENALLRISGIKQCNILVKERNSETISIKYLVGYYVLDNNINPISSISIIDQLSSVLPDYMLPSSLVEMDSFPLTVNGKLDKRSLPDPIVGSIGEEYVAPTTDIEMAICTIWQKALGLERVGITDDFFRIGGNSLLAIRVSHQMSKVLGCEVKVADLLRYKTLSQLLIHNLGQTQINIPISNIAPSRLSFAQERLWFFEQFEEGTNIYHSPFILELTEGTNKEGMIYAFQQIVSRHEVLRSTIELGDDQQGVQIVHQDTLIIKDVRLTSKEDLDSILREDINRPFDLSSEYPIRIKFYDIESEIGSLDRRVLLINMHHIASDGWSWEIFQKELFAYCEAYTKKDLEFSLPPLEIQYKDYAVWQRSYLKGEVLEEQLNYWKSKLSGYEPLQLPTDNPRPSTIDYRGDYERFTLNKETSTKLRALARDYGVTLNSVMLSATNILLGKYTGQDDIVIGSAMANRQYQQIEDLIGIFVNMQVNRTLLDDKQSYKELIQQVHQDQIVAQFHQDLPFERLVDELEVNRDTSRHPIFQVSLIAQSFGKDEKTLNGQKKYFNPFQGKAAYEITKFDLSIFIDDSQKELKCFIKYATSLFEKDTIVRFIDHYIHLLDQLVEEPNKAYSEISLLTPKEYDKIVYEWNDTDKEYPKDKTIYELYQEQVERTPENIALVFEGNELSYRELNEKSNQLARHIREQYKKRTKQELKPDTLIALFLNRSLETVVSILAVLKAGGAYVPIDTSYPQERIDYMLNDTQAQLILCQRWNSVNILAHTHKKKVIYVDLIEEVYIDKDTTNLPKYSQSKDLAYVLFTSGTTGRPKGVMTEHSGLINLVEDLLRKYKFGNSERLLLFHNYIFDVSFEQIAVSIMSGVTLYIIDNKSILDSSIFIDFILSNQITHLHATPSYLGSIDPSELPSVKRVLFGAEYLSKDLFNNFKKYIPEVINKYGPTESSVTSLISINSHLLSKASIQNTKIYILDTNNNPVPSGVVGELYIGGAGLARGYLNNKELTSERFIPNPFVTDKDKTSGYTRIYKTGDLVRWLSNGNMEYIGRNDDQVKIRGYRIELGEIEHVISKLNGIKRCCVLVKERDSGPTSLKFLVGYYVLDDVVGSLSNELILDQISSVLPEYMVPNILIEMDSFPLTRNGKLDKASLPEPEYVSMSKDYVEPTSRVEKIICKIWETILGLERVGITDNFFGIGGNSLLAIRVSHQMSKALDNEIQISDVFKFMSIDLILKNVTSLETGAENVEKEF